MQQRGSGPMAWPEVNREAEAGSHSDGARGLVATGLEDSCRRDSYGGAGYLCDELRGMTRRASIIPTTSADLTRTCPLVPSPL